MRKRLKAFLREFNNREVDHYTIDLERQLAICRKEIEMLNKKLKHYEVSMQVTRKTTD